MPQHRLHNFVYYVNNESDNQAKSENIITEGKLQKFFESLSKIAMKETSTDFHELESMLENSISQNEKQDNESKSLNNEQFDNSGTNLTKLLKEKGYLRDNKNWLTNKGFFEIGGLILRDIMKNLNSDEIGYHETKLTGRGNILIDTTNKFEIGNDIKSLSVPQTLFNTVKRLSGIKKRIDFPLKMELDDLEEFESLEDVRASIVYCIDLSSTMKYLIGTNGKSRIEAAKRALWGLYVLHKKFYPSDSISIIGFGSLASIINPYDIPFLKTFDANDNFLHYTNYQAAFRLAKKILQKNSNQNKRIVLITDGQPSACFIDNPVQKNEIVSEKPYSNFYTPDRNVISKIRKDKDMKLAVNETSLVYLCYRYKKVDTKINERTLVEAKKCKREGIDIDTIVVSEEEELLKYVLDMEKELKGKTYHINQENMEQILVHDYITNLRKILSSNRIL